MSYGDRLKQAMTAAKVSRRTLATSLGMSVQAVGQVIAGKTKALDATHHTRAAIELHCDPLWLATGRPAPATALTTGERPPVSAYDTLTAALTTTERDLLNANARAAATGTLAPTSRVDKLPERPDGKQRETIPGKLD